MLLTWGYRGYRKHTEGPVLAPQEDTHAVLQGGADYGAERLAYVADTWMGRLDPAGDPSQTLFSGAFP